MQVLGRVCLILASSRIFLLFLILHCILSSPLTSFSSFIPPPPPPPSLSLSLSLSVSVSLSRACCRLPGRKFASSSFNLSPPSTTFALSLPPSSPSTIDYRNTAILSPFDLLIRWLLQSIIAPCLFPDPRALPALRAIESRPIFDHHHPHKRIHR
ncbi:hypothetical protein ASPZODRAFT_1793121 [Penicilliopsis zonata CBS 506.65]|uniref:Uncharacterized protein n=1 Tax=Penicilliopsis zonata CBS 506.65 TaxID=1073090 RepID=A0A1L9SKT3_9EURO|nr:hypothetical protein ASPZODRAFT_1793121 [Penicilliopsis zonata CBS 506.65]OJJ47849.1 hypothetical protein ASPZODRAFT_1793121 [Penicilliopsis zonata CBS 506.65]